MMLFFLLALVALAAIALLLWTIRAPRVWPLAMMILAVVAMPLRASAATLDTFLTAATPGLLEMIGLVIAAIIAWGTKKAREKWGIEIEANYREGLQSALLTGARLALARQLTGSAAIQIILDHVRDVGAPDAVRHFDLDAGTLTNLAEAKLEQVKFQATKNGLELANTMKDRAF
ncbi:hypothetical protein [Paracoccus litorisediminis]|uniref:Uncharacterized protein n=1 Tax=Paracoccus litorisediminis TaxID=2006130 RepID=A0A844HMD9_9RHOB|nr:hypothetical protein [Paracoccus litorisediminis]MTH61463.1 hypothetical protein [Paracoccus litorisediminis]